MEIKKTYLLILVLLFCSFQASQQQPINTHKKTAIQATPAPRKRILRDVTNILLAPHFNRKTIADRTTKEEPKNQNTEFRQYQCRECYKKFHDEKALKKHQKKKVHTKYINMRL